jgi:hypothetical protein
MKKEARILAFLNDNSLNVDEFHVLHWVHYGASPRTRLLRFAVIGSRGWDGLPSCSRNGCEKALGLLIDKGLLQLVDAAAIERMKAAVANQPAVVPFYALPDVGAIDFTQEGGSLWHRIDTEAFQSEDACFGEGEFIEDSGTFRSEFIGTSARVVSEAVEIDLKGKSSEQILSIEGPFPTGAWKGYWWDVVHPTGFRIVVVESSTPVPE